MKVSQHIPANIPGQFTNTVSQTSSPENPVRSPSALDAFEGLPSSKATVTKWPIRKGALDAPVDLDIYMPPGSGPFPVAVFAHGFLLDKDEYGDLVKSMSQKGCAVVVPQMHRPKIPFNVPSSGEDGQVIKDVVAWLDKAPQDLQKKWDKDCLYAAGHSRGAKAWWQAIEAPNTVKGYLAVDPADGGFETPVFSAETAKNIPSVVVGGGRSSERKFGFLPPAVFPNEGFEKVAKFTGSETEVIRLPNMGHFDMLDPAGPFAIDRWTVVAGADRESTIDSIATAFGKLLNKTKSI